MKRASVELEQVMKQATISGHEPQKRQPKSELFRRGRVSGKSWAARRASYKELDRLADLDARIRHDWSGWTQKGDGMLALPQITGSVPVGDHDAAAAFWREVAGPEWEMLVRNQEFMEGFIEAVIDIYDRVAVELGHA